MRIINNTIIIFQHIILLNKNKEYNFEQKQNGLSSNDKQLFIIIE